MSPGKADLSFPVKPVRFRRICGAAVSRRPTPQRGAGPWGDRTPPGTFCVWGCGLSRGLEAPVEGGGGGGRRIICCRARRQSTGTERGRPARGVGGGPAVLPAHSPRLDGGVRALQEEIPTPAPAPTFPPHLGWRLPGRCRYQRSTKEANGFSP